MTFAEEYRHAVDIQPSPQQGTDARDLTGVFYELLDETAAMLPTVLCGGSIEIASNYIFSCRPLDCHMLLYTREACGCLKISGRTCELKEHTLLYMDCRPFAFRLEPVQTPWRFTRFFVRGKLFADYESLVPFETAIVQAIPDYSPILGSLENLLSVGSGASLSNKLSDAALLTAIMSRLWIETYDLKNAGVRCAPYLAEIKHYLDFHFMEPFRLDDLEKRYHMSKYRICHEFSDTFGVPPLKYLNRKRLENAANLLLSTDDHIHEIALRVGYENTNHFINLFKRQMGTTPQAYRDANRG